MATGKSYFARSNYRFLPTDHVPDLSGGFELDETDIYGVPEAAASPEVGRKMSSGRHGRRVSPAVGATASSLPVNIPDWSKILKEEYRRPHRDGVHSDEEDEDGGEDNEGGWRVPPHEFLARQRVGIASFSVHEGIGRTLKGRDLRRVRNAIWEKTGFQD